MPKKPSKTQLLHRQLSMHYRAAEAASECPTVLAWHKAQIETLTRQLKDLYADMDKHPLPEAVARARDACWRHFGAIGQLRHAQAGIRAITGLETATDEAKDYSSGLSQRIDKLIYLLGVRKEIK